MDNGWELQLRGHYRFYHIHVEVVRSCAVNMRDDAVWGASRRTRIRYGFCLGEAGHCAPLKTHLNVYLVHPLMVALFDGFD